MSGPGEPAVNYQYLKDGEHMTQLGDQHRKLLAEVASVLRNGEFTTTAIYSVLEQTNGYGQIAPFDPPALWRIAYSSDPDIGYEELDELTEEIEDAWQAATEG